MNRNIALIGAPSSIGIRPYDDGQPRRLDLAPGTLRELGLVSRIAARDLGDVVPAPYRDFIRPPGRVRNEDLVQGYCLALSGQVEAAIGAGSFALVVGGDCSIVLGAVRGARAAAGGPIGLVYLDGHADFATPQESRTGSAASMCLGMVAGRGDTPLARLAGAEPLVEGPHIALIGRRDLEEPWYGHEALARSGALDLPDAAAGAMGYAAAAETALARVASPELAGFWVHFDVDVLDPAVMPAVDSPEPGGPGLAEIVDFLAPLLRHPQALGLELTIYDPALDPGRAAGARLVDLLAQLLGPDAKGASS